MGNTNQEQNSGRYQNDARNYENNDRNWEDQGNWRHGNNAPRGYQNARNNPHRGQGNAQNNRGYNNWQFRRNGNNQNGGPARINFF